jgi:glycosyltransferase involved in cell wall biosynthesis
LLACNPRAGGKVTERPDVTVVIPTRSRWTLLRTTLRGALSQEDVELEVIVVDDASNDETPDRLREIEDPRLRVVRNETARGVAGARNRGVAEARSPWLAFLDDDDLWSPRKLRAQLDAAADQDATFVYGGGVVVNGDGAVLRGIPVARPEDVVGQILVRNVVGAPSTVMARTEIVRRTGGFDPRLSLLADWDLWIRLSGVGKPAVCRDVLVGYLEHARNMHILRAHDVFSEFDYLTLKHRSLAATRGVRFDRGLAWRSLALAHRRTGRRLRAAGAYLRAGWKAREPSDLFRAAGTLAGERAMELGTGLLSGQPPEPDWLSFYR